MYQKVSWSSPTQLDCGCSEPADVSLKLVDGLIATSGQQTVEATLLQEKEVKDLCGLRWQYTFTYDDTQLISGARISGADILGVVCHGAFTSFAEDLVNHPWVDYSDSIIVCGTDTLILTDITVFNAYYRKEGSLVYVNIEAEGETTGAPGPYLYASLPTDAVPYDAFQVLPAHTYGPTPYRTVGVGAVNAGKVQVGLASGSDWSIGTGRGFQVSGQYRAEE